MNEAWVSAAASPSLAVVKYWGKMDVGTNLPATPSLGVSLGGLQTNTRVSFSSGLDRVSLDGEVQPAERFSTFFDAVRDTLNTEARFEVESRNTFATAAGLASSASGFAALARACVRLCGSDVDDGDVSALARVGSGSAARSVFGGFTAFPAGSDRAEQLFDAGHWPELRVVVCTVHAGAKEASSREAMERARRSSPYYREWVSDAPALFREAKEALIERDIEKLGDLGRLSYLRMFSTMFSSRPPVLYWRPESLSVIRACSQLRSEGLPAWETMDAGPQVKILTLRDYADRLRDRLEAALPGLSTLASEVGLGARVLSTG
jgi:diphosphomevalonate decarboxylase